MAGACSMLRPSVLQFSTRPEASKEWIRGAEMEEESVVSVDVRRAMW